MVLCRRDNVLKVQVEDIAVFVNWRIAEVAGAARHSLAWPHGWVNS
jgi:hypothetical protein